jgi:hypothetical protein
MYPPRPTPAQKREALTLLLGELEGLPCPECRGHAARYLLAHPPCLEGCEGYQLWAFDFHNAVSARVGRPVLSWEEYRRLYAQERALADCGVGCRRALRPPAPGLGATLALLARGGLPPEQGGLP